ncbi:hypothetical protein GCM10027162_53200 [Streptomyces incanus]
MAADPTGAFGAQARAAVGTGGAPARLRRTTGVPVVFGGLVGQGLRPVRTSRLSGTATPAPISPAVVSGSGLGGRAGGVVAVGLRCSRGVDITGGPGFSAGVPEFSAGVPGLWISSARPLLCASRRHPSESN